MKTAIKLVLLYLGFQILGGILGLAVGYGYSLIRFGNIQAAQDYALAPSLLFGFIFMSLYLWKAGYISREKATWSPVSALYLLYTFVLYVAAVFLIDFLMSLMPWIPDLLKSTFDVLQSGWLGILSIALLGPILEEVLFRGAITRVLLKKYSPGVAILLSALIFGIFHLNPAQIVSAFLIGLILGWLYYKTASLIPCILVHVLNNSLSVYLGLKFPQIETTGDLFTSADTYYLFLTGALVVFVILFILMNRITIPYPWKKEIVEEQA